MFQQIIPGAVLFYAMVSTITAQQSSPAAQASITMSSSPTDRKVFSNSVVPLPKQSGFQTNALRPSDKAKRLELQFALQLRNMAELSSRVAKGEVISPTEMQEKYAPSIEDFNNLREWLKKNHFEISSMASDRTSIYASATTEQIEQALQLRMARVSVGGVTYNAAASAPSLPSDVGASVLGINGLQPFVRAHKNSVRPQLSVLDRKLIAIRPVDMASGTKNTPPGSKPSSNRVANKRVISRPRGKTMEYGLAVSDFSTQAVASAQATDLGYTIREILTAYHGTNVNVTGKGQVIAILIDAAPDSKDVTTFWRLNQLPNNPSRIQIVNVNGIELPDAEGEETLDTEWTSGIASGAIIRVYAAGSLEFVELDKALDQIIADLKSQPNLHQLSISLGLGESYVPSDEIATEKQKFLTLASLGVNIFVSSGDAGSNPDESGHNSRPGPQQVEYQSSDIFVIGVGGTTLDLDRESGAVKSEDGWSASGGGVSKIFAKPEWQNTNNTASGTYRLVPDVSLAADPSPGAMYVINGKVDQIGGTSWSAPVWAGICALANEARQKAGKKPLGFLPPLIYPIAGSDAFRDIQKGTNGVYTAQAGYDMVTGIGVPNIDKLIEALTQYP